MASLRIDDAQHQVAGIFLSYLGRAPEFTAMSHYVDLYEAQLDLHGRTAAGANAAFKAVSAQVYADAAAVGEVPTGRMVTNAWYVDYVYGNVLGREPDAGGAAYWVQQLDTGAIERAELVAYFVDAAMGDPRDAAYVANRTDVAVAFGQWENSNPSILGSLRYNAAQVLEGVDETPESLQDAQARLYDNAHAGGKVFILTPEVDVLLGSSLQDRFDAILGTVDDKGATLTAFDDLDGFIGGDTLNIYTNGPATLPLTASIRSIETINYRFVPGATPSGTIAAERFEGAEVIWQIGGATDITGVAAEVSVGLADVDIAAGTAAVPAVPRMVTAGAHTGWALGETRSLTIDGVQYHGGGIGFSSIDAYYDLIDKINAADIGISAGFLLETTTLITLTAADGAYFEVDAAHITVNQHGSAAVPGTPAENIDIGFTGDSGQVLLEQVRFAEGEVHSTLTVHGARLASLEVEGTVSGVVTIDSTAPVRSLDLALAGSGQQRLAGSILNGLHTLDTEDSARGIRVDLTHSSDLTLGHFGGGDDDVRVALGGNANLGIVLGGGNDTLWVDGAPDVVSGNSLVVGLGAGHDTLTLADLANVAVDTDHFQADLIIVPDFKAVEDMLDFTFSVSPASTITGFYGAQNAVDAAVDGAASLFAALQAVGQLAGAPAAYHFAYDGDTYVYLDNDGNGFDTGDALVLLVGLVALDASNTAFDDVSVG